MTQASERQIPNPVAAVVGAVLGSHYFSHTRLNSLFMEMGAPGDPPSGNCETKCTEWLKRASAEPEVDAYEVLGGVLEHFMEVDPGFGATDEHERGRQRIRDILAKHGLAYEPGGRIAGGKTGVPTKSLESILRDAGLGGVNAEFDRALRDVETDPPGAITAACAIVEAFCKVYIEDERLDLPGDQSIKPLWKTVQSHLGLDPSSLADDDLKRILGGLASIVDGLGAFRTHVGSAHGRGRTPYRPAPRHARLAVHAAHTLTLFALETWRFRRS